MKRTIIAMALLLGGALTAYADNDIFVPAKG
jgi:hypothetical protein